jgi:hypothetical protein
MCVAPSTISERVVPLCVVGWGANPGASESGGLGLVPPEAATDQRARREHHAPTCRVHSSSPLDPRVVLRVEIRSALRRGRSLGEREGGGAPSHSVSGNRLRDFRWGLCPQTPQRDSFASIYRRSLSFWKSPPRFPMGALPPNPAEGFVRVDLSTLSQFLEIASAISDGGFAPKPRRGIRSRRFIDALSGNNRLLGLGPERRNGLPDRSPRHIEVVNMVRAHRRGHDVA